MTTAPNNDDRPSTDDPVLRAVRQHLDRSASTVDAAAVLARVRSSGSIPSGQVRRWARRVAVAAGGLVVAATIAFLFVTGSGPTPTPVAAATAADLVREARETHAVPGIDRCYEITAEWDPTPLRRFKLDPIVRKSKLWTRGDQFWIETAPADGVGPAIAWGQTKDGKVWVAPTRKRGLVYDATEVGEPIARYCDLMSLRVVATLGELLDGYDLVRNDSGSPGEPIHIAATLRPQPTPIGPRFRRVELTLDPTSKVIQTAILTRILNGETIGTLTFQLIGTESLPDNAYDVTGHLDADRIILDGRPFPPKLPGGLPPPKLPGPDPRAKLRDDFLRRMQGKLQDAR